MCAFMSDESGVVEAGSRPFRLPDEVRGRLADVLRDELVRACRAAADRGLEPAALAATVDARVARLRSPVAGRPALVGQVLQQPIGEVCPFGR